MGLESPAWLFQQTTRWSRGDSNPGPPPCKGGALPAKLRPPTVPTAPRAPHAPRSRVGAPGLEPGTSALSGPRSNHLSYAPVCSRTGRLPFVHSGRSAPGSPGSTPALCPRRSARILPPHRSLDARAAPLGPTVVHLTSRPVAPPRSPPAVAPLPGPTTVVRREDLGARCPPLPDPYPAA